MSTVASQRRLSVDPATRGRAFSGAMMALALAGCTAMQTEFDATKQAFRNTDAAPRMQRVTLSAANEVPAVISSATGSGEITVDANGRVTGNVTVSGMDATAAHLHQGATGVAGPVIVPMMKQGNGTFGFAPDAKFTPEQYAAWRSGSTYLNVHSAAHPAGEIRSDQLKGN